jgi:hypothetical protein
MGDLIANAGGRKFLLALLLIIIFTIFVVLDKMTATQFITSVLVDLGVFSGANVASDFAPTTPVITGEEKQ